MQADSCYRSQAHSRLLGNMRVCKTKSQLPATMDAGGIGTGSPTAVSENDIESAHSKQGMLSDAVSDYLNESLVASGKSEEAAKCQLRAGDGPLSR